MFRFMTGEELIRFYTCRLELHGNKDPFWVWQRLQNWSRNDRIFILGRGEFDWYTALDQFYNEECAA